MYDIIVIGTGPAGLTAGIFAARRDLKTLVLGDPNFLPTTTEATIVDDYPGIPNITGTELQKKFEEHSKSFKIEFKDEKAVKIEKIKKGFSVLTSGKKKHQTRTVIIATGAKHRRVNVPGEEKFAGKGVSYCANCDGPFFKGKKVFVIGGGDTAATSAVLLKQMGSDVTIVHRREELRAVEIFRNQIKKEKIPIIWNSILKKIKGDAFVKSVDMQNTKRGKIENVDVDGIFIAVGTVPTSELAKQVGVKTDDQGFIKVDKVQATNVPGVFAAGDCCDNPTKRIITSMSDGSKAAEFAYEYIKENE